VGTGKRISGLRLGALRFQIIGKLMSLIPPGGCVTLSWSSERRRDGQLREGTLRPKEKGHWGQKGFSETGKLKQRKRDIVSEHRSETEQSELPPYRVEVRRKQNAGKREKVRKTRVKTEEEGTLLSRGLKTIETRERAKPPASLPQ